RPRSRMAALIKDLEVLFVPDIGHGALVGTPVDVGRERIPAPGDQVVGAHGELPAPGRAPGQAESKAFPLGLPGGLDHVADDAGAEIAIAAANRQAARSPGRSEERR